MGIIEVRGVEKRLLLFQSSLTVLLPSLYLLGYYIVGDFLLALFTRKVAKEDFKGSKSTFYSNIRSFSIQLFLLDKTVK